MKPETGSQPQDGKMSHDSAHGFARLVTPQNSKRARTSDDPVKVKFARVWEGVKR